MVKNMSIPFKHPFLIGRNILIFTILCLTVHIIQGGSAPISDMHHQNGSILEISSRIHDDNPEAAEEKLLDFSNDHSNISMNHELDNIMLEFLNTSSSNSTENVNSLIPFFDSLADSVGAAQELLRLQAESFWDAYTAKLLLNRLDGKKDAESKEAVELLKELKNTMPVIMRKMIWGEDACTIQNVFYKEYLYQAGDEFVRKNGDRSIFTSVSKNWNVTNSWLTKGSWKIFANESGIGFHITNKYWDVRNIEAVHLAVDASESGNITRNGVASVKHQPGEKNDTRWHFQPIRINNGTGVFNIISMSSYEYLYAGDIIDKDRRNVFTTHGTGTRAPVAALWEIDCSIDHVTQEDLDEFGIYTGHTK